MKNFWDSTMRDALSCEITEFIFADKNDNKGTPLAAGNEIFDSLSFDGPF